ncbi:MAG: rod shape-determining protein RodA, partial [Bacteroidota bacterium]
MSRKINLVASIDWFTIILFVILVIMGWINIYAASFNEEHSSIFDISQRYGKQMIWIAAAFVLAILILIIDSKFYSFFAYPIYGLMIFLLMAVLVFGTEVNGARSWFEFGIVRFQPAEFAKFATTLVLAKYISSEHVNLEKLDIFWILFSVILFPIGAVMFFLRKGNTIFIPVIFFLATPAFLILLQNDTGSAIVYVAFIILLFREGLNGLFILFCLILTVLFIASLMVQLSSIIIAILAIGFLLFFLFRLRWKELLAGLGIFATLGSLLYGVNYIVKAGVALEYLLTVAFVLASVAYILWALRYKVVQVYFIAGLVLGSMIFTHSVDYVFNHVLEDHQKERIEILLGLKSDPLGIGYNVNQSKIAI